MKVGMLVVVNIKFADPNLEIVTAPFISKAGEFGDSGLPMM